MYSHAHLDEFCVCLCACVLKNEIDAVAHLLEHIAF